MASQSEGRTEKLIIGVDPGLSGAVAVVTDEEAPRIVDVFDMPVFEIKNKRKIDVYQLAMKVDAHARDTRIALIEDVGVMTGKEGVVGMFNFGFAAGVVHGVLGSSMVPTAMVKPAVWKAIMGLSRDKDASRQLASRMFPRECERWARKKDDGRAEAVLLAVFGRRL